MLLCLLPVLPLRAQDENDPNQRFNRGLELAQQGKTQEAIEIWQDVLNDVEDRYRPSVHRALGLAHQSLGQLPEAAYHLRSFLAGRLPGEEESVRASLLDVEDKLRIEHRSITVACDPASATIHFGKSAQGPGYPCPLSWWLKPGRHFVFVSAPSYIPATEEIDVVDECAEALRTVVLRPTADAPQPEPEDTVEVIRRIGEAVAEHHTSVLRRLSAERPEVFKGLSSDKAWQIAVREVDDSDCLDALFEILADAGVEISKSPDSLEKVAEFGCARACRIMLPLFSDGDVAAVARKLSLSTPSTQSPRHVAGLLETCDVFWTRTAAACKAGPADSPACAGASNVEKEIGDVFEALVAYSSPETVIAVMGEHAALAQRYDCRMTRAATEPNLSFEDCPRLEKRLGLFYRPGPKDCPLGLALQRSADFLCTGAVRRLAPDVIPEDLAHASRRFNHDGWYVTYVLGEGRNGRFESAVEIGRILAQANHDRCAKDGPDSANCASALHVEKQIELLQEEKARRESPEWLLKQACDQQHDMDVRTERLSEEKKVAKAMGAQTSPTLERLTREALANRASLDKAAAAYRKASGKKFKKDLCR